METKFDELFKGDLMFEEQRNGDVEISDCDFIFCTVDDRLAQYDGKALDRAKYIAKATNLHQEMYEMLESKLDLIRCGIGSNYSGDPKQNPKYLEVVELLAKARGEHENNT